MKDLHCAWTRMGARGEGQRSGTQTLHYPILEALRVRGHF